MIHDWDAVEYERSTDALESAIKAAVQDALSETRNAGRAAFSAYSRARPDRVSAVLASVDNSLRQKLKEGLLEGETLYTLQHVTHYMELRTKYACFFSSRKTV